MSMKMEIARLRLLVACILWVMCWSGQKANGQQGVGLTLNSMTLTNNSIVTNTDIGTGSAALLCTTTYTLCCTSGNPETQWFFPNGSQVPNNPALPYQRTKGTFPGRVILSRNSESTTTGIFRCYIPDASGVTQSLYVGIYTSTTGGEVTISGGINFQLETQPTTDPPVFTLTCTSIGGPATTVSWTRDSDTVTANNDHIITSQVTDTETATYVHTLMVTGRQVGAYTCSVSNSRTSPAAATTLLVAAAGQPGNLGAVTAGPTSIRVIWTAPTSGVTVTGYRIYWSGGSDQGRIDANAGDTAVTITGRTRGLVYIITIVALSNLLSRTDMVTVTLAPSPPTITMASAQSPTSIALTWTPVTGEVVDSYEIMFSYQGPCSGITLTNTTTVGAVSRSHTQTGLQEFSNYIVSVAAVNSGGHGTQTQMVTTMSSAPSGPPQMVTVTAIGTITISVRWDHVDCLQRNSDITGYIVSYGRRGNESDSETETVMGTTVRTYTVMGLMTSTEYFVVVAAMNSDGVTGPFSSPVLVQTQSQVLPPTTPPPTTPPPTTPPPTAPPPTPPAVSPGVATPTSVLVSWSQQPFVNSYEISFHRTTGNQQLGECSSLEHSGNVSVSGSISMYNLTDLQEFSTYLITVIAVNGAGRSQSDPLRVSTQMAAPSSGPEMLRKVETSITIAWDAVNCIERNSNITGYVVRYTPPSTRGTDSVMVSVTGGAGGMVTIDGLDPSTQYSIQVAAVNSNGDVGVFSTAFSVQTAPETTQTLESGSLAGAVVGACIGTALLYTVVLLVVKFALALWNKREIQGDDTKGTHFDTGIPMKECVAYEGVAVHSGMEGGIYEDPQ